MTKSNHTSNSPISQAANIRLADVLSPERICILQSTSKKEALQTLIDCLATANEITDREALAQGIFHRETLMSTGIGLGIAVPHVRLESITNPVMTVGICRTPLKDYDSLDSEPVQLLFMIAAGKNQHVQHIKLLARISTQFKNPSLKQRLLDVPDSESCYKILIEKEF